MTLSLALVAPTSSTTPLWLTVLLASIPATAAVLAAAVAGRYAHRARLAEANAARVRELENRIDVRKYETYKPMLDLIQAILSSANKATGVKPPNRQDMLKSFAEFSTWVSVFGSDEAVRAFHNMMQATFHNPPAELLVRIYADFMIAARRDMGYSDTSITVAEVLGLRLTDIYDKAELHDMATLPFDELAAKHGWQIPWQKASQ